MDNHSACIGDKDLPTALVWLRKAADGGLARSRFKLGMLTLNGVGMPKDQAAGAKLIIDSAPDVLEDTKPLMIAGTLYLNGVGVKKNVVEAVRHYRMARDRNDPQGQQALGEVTDKSVAGGFGKAELEKGFEHLNGKGVPKDEARAFALFKEAAEAGNRPAMGMVGLLYHEGKGTKADAAQAAYYWHTAALLGVAPAKRDYGIVRCDGTGIAKDQADGLKWIKEAAAQGEPESHAVLGSIHEKGECGQPKDLAKARVEYKIAADGGSEAGKKALERLGK
jgi:TPR repeat protein